MALKQIKNQIRSTERTRKVTKAMEAVSAVKMRRSQERALSGRSYAEAALRILARVSGSIRTAEHPFVQTRESGKKCVVVVTSDKGLAGNLNTAVIKAAHAALAGYKKEEAVLICLGKKGYEHFSHRGYIVHMHKVNISDDVDFESLTEIVQEIQNLYLSGVISSVSIAYQHFASTFAQEAVHRQVLPLNIDAITAIVAGITPESGKYSDPHGGETPSAYTYEPDQDEVLRVILPRLVQILVYHATIESKASEHSARMISMKNASDKALEISKALTLEFNKERQAVITREVSEITGGIEAMAQN